MQDLNKLLTLILKLISAKTKQMWLKVRMWWTKKNRNNVGKIHYLNGTDFKALPKGLDDEDDPWD